MSSSNSIPVGDTITDGVSIVYVSSNGDDANSGLNSAEPKLTIAAALTTAYGFPSLGRRVVKCIDASVFTENVAVSQVVDIEMPHARIIGTLGAASNLGRMSFDVAIVQGNVTVRAFSHYTFEQVSGNLIIENCNPGDSYVHAEDWVTGSVVTTNAAGVVTFNIVHNDANLDIPTDISGFTPKGLVDGEPVNPSEYARSLETLTGDFRLKSSAVHYPDGAQVVYVSANGSNSSSGLSVHEAVQTLNQALSVAAGLPSTARRIIACLDGSHFTENFNSANDIDLFLPIATVTGNIGGSTGNKTFVRIGTLKGDLTMGTQDTVEIDELQGDISYPSGSHTSYLKVHHFLSGTGSFDSAATGYCHIEIDMPRNATVGSWPSGMYIFGHIGENTYTNGVSLVNELTKLTGANRLDASAIKNLPSGSGDSHPYADLTDFGAAGNGWYDLITWPSVTELDTSGADFVLFLSATNTDAVLTYRININTIRGADNPNDATMMRIIGRIERGLSGQSGSKVRIIRDDISNVNSPIRLQLEIDSGNTYNGLMTSYIALDYPSGAVFGSGAKYTPTGSELIVDSISTENWGARRIIDGSTGGIACASVGEHIEGQTAYIDFSNSTVNVHASEQVVQRIASHGTRFSAGEYGEWEQASSDQPFSSSSFPQVTAVGRTDPNDTSKNPFGDAVLDGVLYGIDYQLYAQPGGANERRLRWNNIGTSSNLQIDITGNGVVVGATIGMKATFQGISNAPDADETFEVRVGSVSGVTIATWNIAENFVGEINFEFKHAVTAQEANTNRARFYIVQTAGAAGAGNRSGMARYAVTIDSVEPSLQTNVVGQFDSNYRGVLLPRIAPITSAQHSQGVVALNALDNRNLIIHNGTNWSKIDKHTNVVTTNTHSYTYSAELSLAGISQPWEIQNAAVGTDYRVEPIDGFPAMAHFLGTTGWAYVKPIIQNDDQFWTDARANGLVCKTRFKYVAGQVGGGIEINAGTGQGFGGTYRVGFAHIDASTFELNWITSTTDLNVRENVTLNKNEMYDLQILIPPGEDIYHIFVNGLRVGTGAQCSGYSGRIIRTFIGGHADRNFQIQSHGFYVLGNNAASRMITQEEINNDARIIISETAKTSELLLPKGLQVFDKTIEIENGSAQIIELKASSGDTQLIGGETIYNIRPFSSIRIRQTDLPWGNQWSVSDPKPTKTPETQGKEVKLTVSGGSLATHAQHGTYSGNITVTRATGAPAGAYVITPSNLEGHVFSTSNTYISAQLIGAPVDYEIKVEFAQGLPEVRCYNASNALIDHDFSLSLAW